MFNSIAAAGIVRGAYREAVTNRTRDDLPSYGAAALGYMKNVDSTHSVGVSAELGYGLAGRFSLKAHWRQWKPRGSIDVSAGPLAVDVFSPANGGDARNRAKGVTSDVALVARNGIGVFAGGEIVSGSGRTSTGLHAGLHLESGWAVGAALITAGVYALFGRGI